MNKTISVGAGLGVKSSFVNVTVCAILHILLNLFVFIPFGGCPLEIRKELRYRSCSWFPRLVVRG